MEALISSADAVGTCVICFPEVIATLCRCEQERRITRREYISTKSILMMDMADMDLVQLTDSVMDRTVHLLERIPLKASDALHIASALEWEADAFVSADKRQRECARRAGLKCIVV